MHMSLRVQGFDHNGSYGFWGLPAKDGRKMQKVSTVQLHKLQQAEMM